MNKCVLANRHVDWNFNGHPKPIGQFFQLLLEHDVFLQLQIIVELQIFKFFEKCRVKVFQLSSQSSHFILQKKKKYIYDILKLTF